ncbi:MAG: hypothetical protein JXB39_04090 [Deltaproteobacteria bacterium]|nr:hypothetical protein [Deltaproteobacteria bacterium]
MAAHPALLVVLAAAATGPTRVPIRLAGESAQTVERLRPAPSGDEARTGPLSVTEPCDVFLPGGEVAVLAIDLEDGTVSATLPPDPVLTEDALAALGLAPAWVRDHLALTLSRVDDDLQDAAAELMSTLDEPDARDELAFLIASTTPEELAEMDQAGALDLLAEIALGPYVADPYIAFADLVETGNAGVDDDWSTTVRYTYTDLEGDPATWDLPTSIYYWFVVGPKLDMELPLRFDPERYTLADPPRGVFWRDWFLLSSQDERTFDYRTHWLEEEPVPVEDPIVQATGWMSDFEVDPLDVVVDAEGRTLLAEIDWGAGTILASTIDLGEAWENRYEDLATNAFLYVHRRAVLEPGERVAVLVDPDEPKGWEYGITASQILEGQGLEADVLPLDANTLAKLSGYPKVVVVAHGGFDWSDTVAANAADLEAYAAAGGTLLVLLVPPPDEEGAVWPGGFVAHPSADDPDNQAFEGHPVLGEVLRHTASLWDLVEQPGLSGDRTLTGDEVALDAIGWWVSQNLFDNVSEYSATHDDTERSVWPQRILHNHYGNCGELQDMITAAARTTLIATQNVWSIEDHVWNEFYFQDAWHPWQVSWSDGPTHIDSGAVAADDEFGGGKHVSAIMGFQGNGRITSASIAHYSDTITLDVEVTDGAGLPVDGAAVVVLTPTFYAASAYLDTAAWTHTGPDGRATVHLGEDRDFWVVVRAPFDGATVSYPFDLDVAMSGSYPTWIVRSEAGDPFISAKQAVPEARFTFTHAFDETRAIPVADDPGEPASGPGVREVDLSWSFGVDASFLDVPAADTFLGWYASMGYAYGGALIQPLDAPVGLDLFLVDQAGYDAFLAGEPFTPLYREDGVVSSSSTATVHTADPTLYLVASNRGSQRHTHFATLTLTALEVGPPTEAEEEPGGCGCGTASPRRGAGLLLLAAALAALARRRR